MQPPCTTLQPPVPHCLRVAASLTAHEASGVAFAVRTVPVAQESRAAHPHHPPHTPRAAHCGDRCSWLPCSRPAPLSNRRCCPACECGHLSRHVRRARKRSLSPPSLCARKTELLTLTIQHGPQGLLTVMIGAAGSLAAALHHSPTASAALLASSRLKAHEASEGAFAVPPRPCTPEKQNCSPSPSTRHTPRAAHCGDRCSWLPCGRHAPLSDYSYRPACE